MRSRLLVGAGAVAALGVWLAVRGVARHVPPVVVGSPAPPFRAAGVDPPFVERTLQDYAGEVLLINVWATWCQPCLVEMPSLERLHRRYANAGLRIVAVSIDDAGAGSRIREFRDRLGLTFEILHDVGDIRSRYQTAGVPESFVIGRDGRILRRVFSAEDWDSRSNRAVFAQLLGLPPGPGSGP
ncbi:MAG: TlpA disulfide reductase family protein [Gemmatimonadaceae bacterium]